jgi:threonine dehydratase
MNQPAADDPPVLFSRPELDAAARLVHAVMAPTPQYAWPLLAARTGQEVWVKHENHTPTGAFKIRGGLVYMDWLRRTQPHVTGVITATRGNHGQSIAFAARRAGLRAVIYVPHGNAVEKNAAMRAFGAELVEHGADFDEAKEACASAARAHDLHFVPSFHKLLSLGVATYALELFQAVADLERVYVPVGMGSGICGLITARDLLGLKTQIIGVVADAAPAIALSFAAKRPIGTTSARTFADGMACRDPNPDSVAIIARGAARIVRLSEDEIAAAIRAYYEDTHNMAEGAGAAPLAGLLQDIDRGGDLAPRGGRVGLILCGQNIDRSQAATVLAGGTPAVSGT